jgi:hypothetical protein
VQAGERPCTIWQESFSEEQGRKQTAQYWSYEAGSQVSPFWEVLQTMQEVWGRTYHTCHQVLSKVRERQNGESQFPCHQEGSKKSNPAKQLFAQLSKKLDKLEKSLKKASLNSKKRHSDDSDSDSK